MVYSVELYLKTNWPNSDMQIVPSAHEAFGSWDQTTFFGKSSDTDPKLWAAISFIFTGSDQLPRAKEGSTSVDVRIVVFDGRDQNDRLGAMVEGSKLADLFDTVVLAVTDRTNESTTVGYVDFDNAVCSGPFRDDRGVAMATVEVAGTAYTN